MTPASQPRTVTMTRDFDAPIELVWAAWTNPDYVVRWMKCDEVVVLEVENWVPAVGTRYRTVMTMPGEWSAAGTGVFTAVDPPRLLEYRSDADAGMGVPEMTVRVELESIEGGTRVVLRHTGIPSDEIFGVINAGWTSSLSQLAGLLADHADTMEVAT